MPVLDYSTSRAMKPNRDGLLVIPNNFTKIDSCAFLDRKDIKKVIFPPILESIGVSAFEGCTGLTGTLELPLNLKYIGVKAFYCCIGLRGALVIPPSVEEIGEKAFRCCKFLNNLYIRDDFGYVLKSVYLETNCKTLTRVSKSCLLTLWFGIYKLGLRYEEVLENFNNNNNNKELLLKLVELSGDIVAELSVAEFIESEEQISDFIIQKYPEITNKPAEYEPPMFIDTMFCSRSEYDAWIQAGCPNCKEVPAFTLILNDKTIGSEPMDTLMTKAILLATDHNASHPEAMLLWN